MMLPRAAMCSAPCLLLHWPKLVHGHKLGDGLPLAMSLLLPGRGTANLVAVLPLGSSQTDSLRLGQDWFGFFRGTKHELCCVSDSICCESHFRLVLCLKKWSQDQDFGCECSPAQPVFAFSCVQCQKSCSKRIINNKASFFF